MADYPSSIFSLRTIANLPGIVYDALKSTTLFAEDISAIADEVTEIETILGTNPQDVYPTVSDRIAAAFAAGGLTVADFVFNQKPAETPNGTTLIFTLPDHVETGTLVVFGDGVRLAPTDDYSYNDTLKQVTFINAPQNIVICDYIKA